MIKNSNDIEVLNIKDIRHNPINIGDIIAG